MTDLVTNADDVEIIIEPAEPNVWGVPTIIRIVGEDFTLTTDQDIASVSGFGQNAPKGLTKGDLEYSFDFNIEGENKDLMRAISDDIGDARPFAITARKPGDWEYSFTVALAESEEISGTTGEAIGLSVEGMAAGRDRDLDL